MLKENKGCKAKVPDGRLWIAERAREGYLSLWAGPVGGASESGMRNSSPWHLLGGAARHHKQQKCQDARDDELFGIVLLGISKLSFIWLLCRQDTVFDLYMADMMIAPPSQPYTQDYPSFGLRCCTPQLIPCEVGEGQGFARKAKPVPPLARCTAGIRSFPFCLALWHLST